MIQRLLHIKSNERRAIVLAVIIILQAICAMFFLGDVLFDISAGQPLDDIHLAFEAIASVALVGGVIYLMIELRKLINRMDAMDVGIRAAQGDMTNLIFMFFDRWRLTASEQEVALFVIKGLDNDTIAQLRGTAPGTVRAQCTQIYKKAGVDGRTQLLSVFVEELFDDEKSVN